MKANKTLTKIIGDVLGNIEGQQIEAGLLELAAIGGEEYESGKWAPYRLALTPEDEAGRDHIKTKMKEAGLKNTIEHPLATIGMIPGSEPTLPPVLVLSHIDTVPKADNYDGTLGVVGGINAAKAMNLAGVKPRRSILFMSLTGEESSHFNFALFGSAGVFRGLTDKELDATNESGISIRETLGKEKSLIVQRPLFGSESDQLPLPYAAIELHVEQGKMLEDKGIDLGVVEAIAAPVRYRATIGDDAVAHDNAVYPYSRYIELVVNGKADHSGATPMGKEYRADGLFETARIGKALLDAWPAGGANLDFGTITIDAQALNKIPGRTTSLLRLTGDNKQDINKAQQLIQRQVAKVNESHRGRKTRFDPNPISITEVTKPKTAVFYEPDAMHKRHKAAFEFITHVNAAAEARANENVVATVGTWIVRDGQIELGLDVRGIDKDSRGQALAAIDEFVTLQNKHVYITLGEKLSGSDDPVTLDQKLVTAAMNVIQENNIGSAIIMHSAAGHDAQNSQRVGVPTVMFFVPSKDGLAHNPEAYTAPEYLEKGVKALAVLAVELAT
jgi:allantoate deiminase